ncbi:preprotein translocase subunit SecG [Thermodesulfobacteriota bacterium]
MKLIIILIHVAACVGLILIVLLQKGKGADMGAVFGGSSQTLFGSSGATSFFQKLTAGVAIVFMISSLTLAFLFGKGATSSVMEGMKQPQSPVTEQSGPPTGAPPTPAETPSK